MFKEQKIRLIHAVVISSLCNFLLCMAVQSAEPESKNMMSEKTTAQSGSGQPVYRHEPRTKSLTTPVHSNVYLEEIEAHVEHHLGKIKTVLHEVESDIVHIDVLWIPATKEQPYHLLVTSGVSDLPIAVPEDLAEHSRVELMIALPKEWPLTEESFKDENSYWPVRWLKKIGRLPHEHDTWLGWGHTIPNGNPIETIANTKFTGVMLAPSYLVPTDFFKLKTKDGNNI